MEENNGLQDILLDKNEEDKSNKMRKLLIGIAVAIILFLIVLIIVKSLNSGGNKHQDLISDDNTLILPDESNSNNEQKISNDVFEQVPIISEDESKQNFENIVNDYKNSKVEGNSSNVILPKSNAENEIIGSSSIKRELPVKIETTTKSDKPSSQKAKEVGQNKNNVITKNTTKKSSVSTAKDGETYIQVASVNSFDSSSPLVKKIEKEGYKYRTYQTTVNGKNVTKILIGPYKKSELSENIGKIRQDISKNAFIYTVK